MSNSAVCQRNWLRLTLAFRIEHAYDGGMSRHPQPTPPDGGERARATDFLDWLTEVDGARLGDRERLELIAVLERVKAAAAGAQAKVTAAFADSQRADHVARGGKAAEVARSIGAQVALARRDSPTMGDRHLGLARALVTELPHTLRALAAGELSEFRATIVARETATLSREDRALADERLAADLPHLGTRAVAGAARRIAAELDAASVVRQHERAVSSRRVSLRPAPAGMAYLTFLAPLKDAVAAYAATGRLADAALSSGGPDPRGRSRGQLMVDLGLDRILGRADGAEVPVEIQLVMTAGSLFARPTSSPAKPTDLGTRAADPADEAATISGFGPIPAPVARAWVRSADRAWIRRLFTSPDGRDLVAMESRRRLFDGSLRKLLIVRDQTCRTPWCDAPIRQVDHAQPARDDGPTDVENGQGLCARCNLTKEAPGWSAIPTRSRPTRAAPAPDRPDTTHRIQITTPTGLTYRSTAPPVLGWGWSPPEPTSHPSVPSDELHALTSPLERQYAQILAAA